MDIREIVTVAGSVFAAFGGVETIKYFLNRKNASRMSDADADIKEVEAKSKEFEFLEKRAETAEKHNAQFNEQLLSERAKYHEQTLLVRKLNEQLLQRADEIADLREEISALKAERKMKLCERKGCDKRQPQSGY